MLNIIKSSYGKSPYFQETFELISKCLNNSADSRLGYMYEKTNQNMIPERIELYGDIFKSLYRIISETYLGEESSETKISMSDDDKTNHFEWCWKTLLDNFAKENIIIKHGGKHKDYFQEFFKDTF